MQARLRRLAADFQGIQNAFSNHPYVKVISVEGNPPDRYIFEFTVAGLIPAQTGFPQTGSSHRAEVFLPIDYPRRPPFCRMTTPVYHPNIDPQKICIGDHWSAGQSLSQLVLQIAQMICYQSYNVKSPLNAEAAAWAEQNMSQLPLEKADISAGI
jgi:ubiquitin-protein ligase